MKKIRNIFSIISLLIFGVIVYIMFAVPARLKKKAFKLSFSGTVISTLEEKRSHNITVEITNSESRCFIFISGINAKNLYPQYRDSIFKEPNSSIMFLKKDQQPEILPMNDIDCLNIDCFAEKDN